MIVAAARRIAFVLALAAVLVAIPAVAQARFVRSTSGSSAVTTDVLSTPVGVTVTRQCGVFAPNVSVSWTAASDSYATGYVLTMTRSNGTSTTTAVNGRTSTAVTVSIGFYTPVTFTVMTTYRNWTSVQTASTAAVQCGLVN